MIEPQSPSAMSREMASEVASEVATEVSREVDRAALLGAALAAIVALTFAGDGAWDWLASLAGLALLAIIAAFFRLPRHGGRYPHAELVAMALVAGLAAALVLAAPVQSVLAATSAADSCRADGALARAEALVVEPGAFIDPSTLDDAAAEQGHHAFDVCLGSLTNDVLWVPSLAVALLVVAAAETVRVRRKL